MSYFQCNICGQYKGMIGMIWHPCACETNPAATMAKKAIEAMQNQNPVAPLPSSEGTTKKDIFTNFIDLYEQAEKSETVPTYAEDYEKARTDWNRLSQKETD